MPRSAGLPTLTLRELNRALLSRQLLLRRVRMAPAPAIERLGALQGQWPPAPYIALWSRLQGFKVATLETALQEGTVVKATVMRGTLHLMSATDYPHYAVASQERRQRVWPSWERAIVRYYGDQSPETRRFVASWSGLGDTAALRAALLRHARKPRTGAELIEVLASEAGMPRDFARHFIWAFVSTFGGLVHVPASAGWASRGSRQYVAAQVALGRHAMPDFEKGVTHTVRRYLAAFGPASLPDIASWTHIRAAAISEALRTLGRETTEFSDEAGRRLYDLARAPRPPADTAAPVRYLAKWDSPLLAYSPAERVRILPERYRRTVIAKNGDVVPTVLVDGMVAARWDARVIAAGAVLSLAPLRRLTAPERADVVDEGERLVRFIHPDAKAHQVRFVRPDGLPAWNLAVRP